MTTKDQYDKLVEKYRSGDLDGDDLIAFEKELKINSELQKVYKLHEEIDQALKDKEANALRDTLEDAYVHLREREKKKRIHMISYISVAASIIILIGLGLIFLLQSNRIMSNDEIYELYYSHYEIPSDYRSDVEDTESVLKNAISNYNHKNFETSFELFKSVIYTDSSKNAAYFLAGLSLMELSKYQDALSYFSHVISQNDIHFGQQSEWFLALSYIGLNDIQNAEPLLEKITANDQYNNDKAGKILRSLRE